MDVQLIALSMVPIITIGLLLLLLLLFIIKRHFLFAKYIKGSNIQFLPITSYISGSWNLVASEEYSSIESVKKIYKRSIDKDTFAFFFGPMPIVITQDLDLIHKVFVTDGLKHINRPNISAAIPEIANSIVSIPDEKWRKIRRAMASTMTPAKLKFSDIEQDVDACVDKMLASLKYRQGQNDNNQQSLTVNSLKLLKDLSMDISLRFGVNQPDQIDYLKENEIITSAEGSLKQYAFVSILSVFCPVLIPIVIFLSKALKMRNYIDHLKKITNDIISNNRAHNNNDNKTDTANSGNARKRSIIIDALLDEYNKKKIDHDDLVSNIAVLVLAAWDTTGETLAALTWYLATNPEVQDKLRHSILAEGLDSQYLDWTLKEVLRLFPTVGGFREIGEDFQWKNYKLMKGMTLAMFPHLIHRNPTYWGDDALEFCPERFGRNGKFHPAQYSPFGLGPRHCVGNNIAMVSIKQIICRLILAYKLEPNSNTPRTLELKTVSEAPIFVFFLKEHNMELRFSPLD